MANMDNNLALYGGPRAVPIPNPERWRKIGFGDLLQIMKLGWRDVNTFAGGSGPIRELEEGFKQLTGTRFALMVNSGTAALHSAFFAAGAAPGTEVIVPSYTFFASAAPILQCGATPVFCDVDPCTLTADPDDVESKITPRTRAICVVHVWGNPARMEHFEEIARRHQVVLIEDCSHAQGAMYKDRPVGSWGDIGCFSLQGDKAVSGGEAGVVVTSQADIFNRMLALGHFGRLHQQTEPGFDLEGFSFGFKYRPHCYAAVLAAGSLKRLPELNRLRRQNYALLSELLDSCPALEPIEVHPDAQRGGFLEFVFRYVPEQAGDWNIDAFVKAAAAEGIPVWVDRYTRISLLTDFLHQAKLFSKDWTFLGGNMPRPAAVPPNLQEAYPGLAAIHERLISMPAWTRVPEQYVRMCALGFTKVACFAREMNTNTRAPDNKPIQAQA